MTLAYSQPNESEATFEPQARGYGEEIEIIAAAASVWPLKAVLDGCAVSPSSGLTVASAAGVVWYDGAPYVVAADTATAATADGSNPRLDYVYYDVGLDNVAVATGTAATKPQPPDLDDDWVLLAELTIPAALATISASHIIDKRVIGGVPADQGIVYVNPAGVDPGASTWTGWGRRPEVAFTTTADAITAATSGDTIAMMGNESLTAVLASTSKILKFVGLTNDAGWTWTVASPGGSLEMFNFTGHGCEFHELSFATSYAGTFAFAFVGASTANNGRVVNCNFNGSESTTRRVYEGLLVGTGWKIQGCTFINMVNEAIDATGQVTITGCHFSDCGYAVQNTASSGYSNLHSIFSNNYVEDMLLRCLDLRYADVIGNTFIFTDTIGAGTLSGVRCRAESLVIGNRFAATLSSDDISHLEMVEVDDGSSVIGNWFRMGNYFDGFAIATYTGGTGNNLISGNRIRSSAAIDHSIIQMRGPADACIGNYIYVTATGSSDDIIVIDSDSYGQYVADNFIEDHGTDVGANITYVSPYSGGTTVSRGNRVRVHGASTSIFPIPDEAVNIVSTAVTVSQNDELMQISGTNAVTLPAISTIINTKTFKFQRKDTSNNSTINTNSGTEYVWHDGTATYTSISLASNGATVELYFDGTHWVVVSERGTVNYT